MNKKRKTGFWYIVAALILVYAGYMTFNLKGTLDIKKTEYNDIQNKESQEKKLKVELEKQKKMINSDEYMEKMAREKLGMVKKNEKVYIDINR
ncbi:MAG: septum formation initiator family protein [Bacillota bacterium]|nr:septum formation initiator family protein [Bacillota bacterium]